MGGDDRKKKTLSSADFPITPTWKEKKKVEEVEVREKRISIVMKTVDLRGKKKTNKKRRKRVTNVFEEKNARSPSEEGGGKIKGGRFWVGRGGKKKG